MLFLLFCIIISCISCSDTSVYRHEGEQYIAHAGGGIDDNSYTNSLEAIKSSIHDGKKLIEIDLIETSDGHLVGAHHWSHFKSLTSGKPAKEFDELPLTLSEFKKRKILNRYTPVSLKDISALFSIHTDLILVTDKTNNFELIKRDFQHHDRLIVEIFGSANYFEALKVGGFVPAMNTSLSALEVKFIDDNNVKYITTSTASLKGSRLNAMKRLKENGVHIFVYTTNEKDFINKHNGYVTAFYTDYWSVAKNRCVAKSRSKCTTQF